MNLISIYLVLVITFTRVCTNDSVDPGDTNNTEGVLNETEGYPGFNEDEIKGESTSCYYKDDCNIWGCTLFIGYQNDGCCLCLTKIECRDKSDKAACTPRNQGCLGRCICKDPYVWDGSKCACPPGTIEIKDRCIPCPVNTFQEGTECKTCPEGEYQPREGKIDCPCPVLNGYMTEEGGELVCKPCYDLCSKCLVTSTNCQACFGLPGVIQTSNKCHCNPIGYYPYHDTVLDQDECRTCHPLCETCYGPSHTECRSCNTFKGAISFDYDTCFCSEHHYYDSSTEDCRPCHDFCESCFGPSANECKGCLNSFEVEGKESLCVYDCNSLEGYYKDKNACKRNLLSL